MSDFLRQTIEQLRAEGLYRELLPLARTGGRTVTWQGRELLNFASNNYLGLSQHPKLIEASVQATREHGTGSGASRLVSGSTELHARLERAIAELKGAEAALVFPTGYMAAIGAIGALASPERPLAMDKLNHASLMDGGRLAARAGAELRIYPHGNLKKLERLLARWQDQGKRPLIVTDTVFSMDGDLADLPAICELAGRYGAMVMIDEAHATGVFGASGRGAAEHLGVEERIDVHMGTLSKALGGLGGYLAGSRALIDFLVNRARSFIYTTAPPPGVIAAALAAVEIVRSQEGAALRGKLRANASRLREGLLAIGLNPGASAGPIVPVILEQSARVMRVARSLREANVLVGAIRPPTVPSGSARLRISVTAAHEPRDIERLLAALARSLVP